MPVQSRCCEWPLLGEVNKRPLDFSPGRCSYSGCKSEDLPLPYRVLGCFEEKQ